MVSFKRPLNGHTEALLIFICVLALSISFFAVTNQRFHKSSIEDQYQACIKDRQIADNQLRVILAVIDLAKTEENAHNRKDVASIEAVKKALYLVPKFNCKK